MLNDRRQRVLNLLLSADRPLAAAEIGRGVGCPARSVRYDLIGVGDWVKRYGARLVAVTGIGYSLQGDLKKVGAALDQLAQNPQPVYEYILSPRERVRRLLLQLLADDQGKSLHALAERLGVGKSTVHSDLEAMGSWVSSRGLALERSHTGVRVTGLESLRRQAMAHLIAELADEGQLTMLMDGHPDSRPLLALLQPLLPNLDWQLVGHLVRAAEIPELGVTLAVMLSRLGAGYTLPFSPEQVEQAMGTPGWHKVQDLAVSLEQACKVRLPSTEMASLSLFLETMRAGGDHVVTEGDLAVARSLAGLVQSRLGVPLSQDQEFVMGLALHLRPIEHRLRRGLAVENPLLAEVKAKYPAALKAAEDVARVLEATWKTAVPPAEVGYVAIHIAAAIERARLFHHREPRALVVCGAGVGTAQLLATRLRGLVPGIAVGRITTAFHVKEALAADRYDLVITTCQLAPCGLPVVLVSPLLTDTDLSHIRRAMEQIQMRSGRGREPLLKDVLTQRTVALDLEAADWEEAVRVAGALLVDSGAAEERYVDAMIRTARELGPYIVLGPGFALPHARPEEGARQVALAMARLRQPVNFGHPDNDPVDLVFALAAVDHETHLTALMQLSELLGNEEAVAALRAAPDVDTVLRLVDAISVSAEPVKGESRA